MPTVSAIIPCYNGSEWIKDSVQSVLQQEFEDLEVIVVDDGSRDDSAKIVDSIRDDRVRLATHEENRGIPAARNTGIKEASGDYIGFLDQDDRWHPQRLKRQIVAFREGPDDLGIVYGDVTVMGNPDTESWTQHLPSDPQERVRSLYLKNQIITISVLVDRRCFETHGLLDESLYGADDYEFWLRIAEDYQFQYVPEVMAYKRTHDANASDSFERMNRDKLTIACRYLDQYSYLRPLEDAKLAQIMSSYARNYYGQRSYVQALRYISRSLRYDWRRPGEYLLLVRNFIGLAKRCFGLASVSRR